jgi:nicotinamide-nucleotide amidase
MRHPDHRDGVAEIVSAGNEVLAGDVLDSNSNALCRTITGLGGVVRRTVMVRDEVDAIAREVREAVGRGPDLIFTVGGLGPTSDDRTLQGVAAALDRPLELNGEAERQVRERYEEFYRRGLVPFAELNDARRKMARLPAGAQPIVNPIGGAPAVLCRVGETSVVSLPGVPGELVAIVEQSLGDLLARIFGAATYEQRVLVAELQDESAIADLLAAAEAAHPAVYVKSRAKVIGSTATIRITLSARGSDRRTVDALLVPVADLLLDQVAARGFTIREDET